MDRIEPCVIGFSGRIRSGKTTVSQALAEALQWDRASFGDYVRSVAASQGLDVESRAVLQDVGESLVAEGWPAFCQSVLATVNWRPGGPLVVDGIRHAEAVDQLRGIVEPLNLYHVHIQIDDKVRTDRAQRSERQQVREAELHATEADVKAVLPSLADRLVYGARPVESNVKDIVSFLRGQ